MEAAMEAPLSPRAAAPAEDDEWDAALMAGVRADDGDVEGLMLGADGGGFELPQLEADSPGTDGMGWEPSPLGGAEAPVMAQPPSPAAAVPAHKPAGGRWSQPRPHVPASGVFEADAVMEKARKEWLHKSDVAKLLANHERLALPIQDAPQQKLPSGSLVFYDKRATRNFRGDGYDWRKKKDGKQVQEYHEKLKIDGVVVLTCCYTKLAVEPGFQRRVYWLTDKAKAHIALVHYLQAVPPGAEAPEHTAMAVEVQPEPEAVLPIASSPPQELLALPQPLLPRDPPPAAPATAVIGAALPSASAFPAAGTATTLVDCSPDWGFVEGGQKVLLVYDSPAALPAATTASCVFAETRVAAEVVRQGVVRCLTPPHLPGPVHVRVELLPAGGGEAAPVLTSSTMLFTYRRRSGLGGGSGSESTLLSSADENEFYVRLLRTIGSVTGAMQPADAAGGGGGGGGGMGGAVGGGKQAPMQTAEAEELPSLESLPSVGSLSSLPSWGSDASDDAAAAAQPAAAVGVAAGGEKEALRSAAGGLMMRLVEMACLSAGEGGSTAGLQALGAADGDGLTLLHCAAALGFVEVVQLLLATGPAGASMPPNAADNEGCTAMHWACAHGHPLVVDALLKAGGKQLANRDGLTPLDVWLREKAATSDDIGLTLVMDSFNTLEVRAPGEGGGDRSSSGEGLPAAATGPSASSSGSGGSSPGFRSGEPARAGSSLGRPLLSIPEDGATEETTMEDADGTDRFGQVLCADEDRASLSEFIQIGQSAGTEDGSVDPALVKFVQRMQGNARSVMARRRYERLRTTAVKLQSSLRERRAQTEAKEQKEGAARVMQSRFRQSRKGAAIKKQHAKAAHVIQGHVRAYLQEQQEQKQKEAVSTIEDRVKMWLQIRRAVAAELEAEVFSTASESGSESFGIHSDSDLSDLDIELAEAEAALMIQAQVRDWMRTKRAASVIQGKVREWLELQDGQGADALRLAAEGQQARLAALAAAGSPAPASGGS